LILNEEKVNDWTFLQHVKELQCLLITLRDL
jgi:hypothetical protein